MLTDAADTDPQSVTAAGPRRAAAAGAVLAQSRSNGTYETQRMELLLPRSLQSPASAPFTVGSPSSVPGAPLDRGSVVPARP